jgi:hypothetical protein
LVLEQELSSSSVGLDGKIWAEGVDSRGLTVTEILRVGVESGGGGSAE